jgi:transcriptional regulator with XRE-family HTH domain
MRYATIPVGGLVPPVANLDPDGNVWHWIAVELRFWRERAGLSMAQMGRIMGCTKGMVSNIEHGSPRHRMNSDHALAIDKHLELGRHFWRLVLYARSGHDPDWFRAHVQYESKASVIKAFETLYVPGLLQTADYARAALIAGAHVDPESGVATRLARQEILERPNPPLLWAIIDQAVLCRPVGGSKVMKAQLAHLLELGDRANIGVRVVPWSAGEYIGQDGAFKILTSDKTDVAYAEAPTGGRLVLEPNEVRGFGLRYDRVGAKALPEDLSRGLILEVMEAIR